MTYDPIHDSDDITSVNPPSLFHQSLNTDPHRGISICDGPLYRRSTPVPRQERRVDVESLVCFEMGKKGIRDDMSKRRSHQNIVELFSIREPMREVVGRDPLFWDLGGWEVVVGRVFQQCYFCQLTSQFGHDSLVEQEVDLRIGDFRSRGVRTCISSHRSILSAHSSTHSQGGLTSRGYQPIEVLDRKLIRPAKQDIESLAPCRGGCTKSSS